MKHHGPVPKTNNYLRNVILGKDGEPKRFVRPGDGEPLYIMENGKPIRRNTSNHNSKRHQIKNNLKIPTQQQWNNMIKKRHCKRRLREIKRNDASYHYRGTENKANGEPMNHLNKRAMNNQVKQNKGRVNMKVMKNNRAKQRMNKMNKMHPCNEFAFMTQDETNLEKSKKIKKKIFKQRIVK